jgi:transcriptional regulator with XRE-family HTH domain
MVSDPIYKHIGAVIRARRKTLEYKQETLAGMLGISRGSLANVETGRQGILVHKLYKIAAALGLTPLDLLPPALTRPSRGERSELPLPNDLKAQQKEQIARLFDQVNTNEIRGKEGNYAKSAKR